MKFNQKLASLTSLFQQFASHIQNLFKLKVPSPSANNERVKIPFSYLGHCTHISFFKNITDKTNKTCILKPKQIDTKKHPQFSKDVVNSSPHVIWFSAIPEENSEFTHQKLWSPLFQNESRYGPISFRINASTLFSLFTSPKFYFLGKNSFLK
jgi:hypothetical protein